MGNKIKSSSKSNSNISINDPNNIFLSNKHNNLFSRVDFSRIELSPMLFDYKYIIGKGGFGKVYKVILKQTNNQYALKQISKAKIQDKKTEKCVKNERDILTLINHPFIVNLHFSFQDKDNLYLVFDLLPGGDLRYHLGQNHRFTEEQTKFFICCLILGMEYLHYNGVIHRDIKPENLVLDEKGYLRITDFGIARLYNKTSNNETSGTPGYMSPEVLKGQGLTTAVDYFAMGILTFEFMLGLRPYIGQNRKELREMIIKKQIHISKNDSPPGWSFDVVDFVSKLLQKSPANRLGLRSAKEVKEHAWLKGFPWKDLYEKKLVAPFIPSKKDNFDKKYCDGPDDDIKHHIQSNNEMKMYPELDNFDFYRIDFGYKFKNKIGDNSIKKEFINLHEKYEGSVYSGESNAIIKLENCGNEDDSQSLKLQHKFIMAKNRVFSSSNSLLRREYKNNNNIEQMEYEDDNV